MTLILQLWKVGSKQKATLIFKIWTMQRSGLSSRTSKRKKGKNTKTQRNRIIVLLFLLAIWKRWKNLMKTQPKLIRRGSTSSQTWPKKNSKVILLINLRKIYDGLVSIFSKRRACPKPRKFARTQTHGDLSDFSYQLGFGWKTYTSQKSRRLFVMLCICCSWNSWGLCGYQKKHHCYRILSSANCWLLPLRSRRLLRLPWWLSLPCICLYW